MEQVTFDMTEAPKKEKKLLFSFLSKLKTIYKAGCYIISNRFVIPDEESTRELWGHYQLELHENIVALLKQYNFPNVWYIKTTRAFTTTLEIASYEKFDNQEEVDLLHRFYQYTHPMDEFKKSQPTMHEWKDMVEGDVEEWENEMFNKKHALELHTDGILFYYSSRILPFLTAKNILSLVYFINSGSEEEEIGRIGFEYDVELFQVVALMKFIKIKH